MRRCSCVAFQASVWFPAAGCGATAGFAARRSSLRRRSSQLTRWMGFISFAWRCTSIPCIPCAAKIELTSWRLSSRRRMTSASRLLRYALFVLFSSHSSKQFLPKRFVRWFPPKRILPHGLDVGHYIDIQKRLVFDDEHVNL